MAACKYVILLFVLNHLHAPMYYTLSIYLDVYSTVVA